MKLDDLARSAGVSPRTVRYYIQRGLLSAPEFRGPDTRYGEIHLATLRAIRALQERFWPLEAIGGALEGRSTAELQAIVAGTLVLPDPTVGAVPHPPGGAGGHPYRTPAEPPGPPAPAPSERGTRHLLAPGVELFVRDDADAALVRRILDAASASTPMSHPSDPHPGRGNPR